MVTFEDAERYWQIFAVVLTVVGTILAIAGVLS
jgi:hypothetical protein